MASKLSTALIVLAIVACCFTGPCAARQRKLRSKMVSRAVIEKEMELLPLSGPKRRTLATFSGVTTCTNLPTVGASWELPFAADNDYFSIDETSDGFDGVYSSDYADNTFNDFGEELPVFEDLVSLTFAAKIDALKSPPGAKLYMTVIDVNAGTRIEKYDAGSECVRFQYDARDTACGTPGGAKLKIRMWCGSDDLGADDVCFVDIFTAFINTAEYCTASTTPSPPPPYNSSTSTNGTLSNPTNSSSKKSSNTGAIAGAAVGGVVAVGAVAGLAVWMSKKNNKKKNAGLDDYPTKGAPSSSEPIIVVDNAPAAPPAPSPPAVAYAASTAGSAAAAAAAPTAEATEKVKSTKSKSGSKKDKTTKVKSSKPKKSSSSAATADENV